jgi:SARP family transcriptional regulator, regulator of embCAB operon
LRFAILGPVEVWAHERRLDLGGRRQLALLAFLVLHANRAVSTDSLIDGVWETAGTGAEKRLQMAVARLRKVLETGEGGERRLRTVGGGYLLSVAPGELDADVFKAGVHEGRETLLAGDPARASDILANALRLWARPAPGRGLVCRVCPVGYQRARGAASRGARVARRRRHGARTSSAAGQRARGITC